MNFRRDRSPFRFLLIVIAMGAFAGASYSQLTVTISGVNPTGTPLPASTPAPSGQFKVKAAIPTGTPESVVFYRNDVPYKTDTSSPWEITEDQLAQDTYTYRARAYDSSGAWADSDDFKFAVTTRKILKMGDNSERGVPETTGPDAEHDHTAEVQAAVDYLHDVHGGGTLFFPCALPLGDDQARYNISATINVPSNVTLQGESAERWGRCLILWFDVTPNIYGGSLCNSSPPAPANQRNRPMFRVPGGNTGVRFRDMAIFSRASGPNCYMRGDFGNIADEETAGFELNTDPESCGSCPEYPGGDISDIIFENVGIFDFTYGIKAVSGITSEYEISRVKIRGYRAFNNHRQLYINAPFAHEWDVQNLNITSMAEGQGGVEIVNAGRPSSYSGHDANLKFLQLGCAGKRTAPPAFCVEVQKHGGLYFRQLHHESVAQAIIVKDLTERDPDEFNPDPIIFESSVASGKFYDASMKLYLIGNTVVAPEEVAVGLDDVRLRFSGGGLNAKVVDCGDVHGDWTDVVDNAGAPWEDFKMLFTHTERNRASFFAQNGAFSYTMPHKYCPSGDPEFPNIEEVGGDFFDSGSLPNEPGLYSNVLNSTTCLTLDADVCLEAAFDNGGSVYIDGSFVADNTITVPRGMQIIGAPNSQIKFDCPGPVECSDFALFKIAVPTESTDDFNATAIAIRNLKLWTEELSITGIDIVGENHSTLVGIARDLHFTGLTFEGFAVGIDARGTTLHPMIDGISMKNLSFVNNYTAIRNTSANSSNWNVMNLSVTSNNGGGTGWDQTYGGHQSLQGVTCRGKSADYMDDCIKVRMPGAFYLNGLKKTQNVTNTLTVGENDHLHAADGLESRFDSRHFATMVLRNSDFTSSEGGAGTVNILGKAFITSMNNKYENFYVEASEHEGDLSRVTYCDDVYPDDEPYPGLAETHRNLLTWVPTKTRVSCGERPFPFDDVVTLGGETGDMPLVGNIYDDVAEDHIIYRPGSSAEFMIRQAGGLSHQTISWGTTNDIPVVGRFFPGSRAQLTVFRPSTGDWWVKDPNDCSSSNNPVWNWGTSGDIPFTGNFLDESLYVTDNMDEIAVYRPSTKTFWIENPRHNATDSIYATTSVDSDSAIQVGDFLGLGNDQVAQYKNGVWKITDPRAPGSITTVNFGASGDVPVAGRYFEAISPTVNCTQLGVWRPSDQKFYVKDANSTCGSREADLEWGSNNNFVTLFTTYTAADDIPLAISNAEGIRRPAAYRPTAGVFDKSVAAGQWWVHDPFSTP